MRVVFSNSRELRISKGLEIQIKEFLDLLSMRSNISTVDDQNNLCLKKILQHRSSAYGRLIKDHPWFLKFEQRLVVPNINETY